VPTYDSRTAITWTFPNGAVTVTGQGGGVSVDLSSATVLGASAIGAALFVSASAAAARTTLGSTVVGDALFIAANAGAARTAIGATVTGSALIVATDAAAAQTAIGATTVGSAVIIATNAGAARTAIGAADYVTQVVYLPDVLASGTDLQNVVSPVTGTLVYGILVLNQATATGACTATLTIDGVAVTGGVASVTGAAGTRGLATCTAANATIVRSNVIGVTIGGANDAAGDGTLTLLYLPTQP
jgi:hypothetical protein